MSVFASQTQRTMPMADAHSVTIRKLTGREVELAQAEHLRGVASGRGWAGRLQRILKNAAVTDAEAGAVLADPLNGYDRLTMCRAGILAWTYPDPPTSERVADLDDETLESLATEILRLTKPALFQTPAEQEAGRKNG